MSIYRGAGGSGDAVADSSSEALLVRELAVEVQADADAAAASASAAASSASAAATSAINAATAETNAETAEANAETAEANAETAQAAAEAAQAAAEAAQLAAETAETNAETAETNAETAETNAETAATNAASSASAASTSATNASNSATSAATSATNASNSASAAATSATNAASSATSASGSATAAASSASSASTSASNAATSETNAATSASTATTQAGLAATSASNAATSETNAASSASAASTSASNAATSESNAASSASAAATSATNSANSATASASSASDAAASAALAATYTPDQTGHAGEFLTTDGTNTSWATVSGSISVTGGDLTLSGSTGTDITNATLATVNSNTGSFGSASAVPVITVNAKGLVTAVSTATVSSSVMRNRIINGAMMIDQRNAGASVTQTATNLYNLDRWVCYASQASKFTVQQNAGSVTPPAGFTNYLGITSSSAYTVGASEIFILRQLIEGYNVADCGFGTANAKTMTLSFWVRSSLTGTFGGSFTNGAENRSYPFTYTISSANTWEQKTVTFAGDTTGTWTTNNTAGFEVILGLGVGSTYSGTAGSWAGAGYYSATGATSVVGTNGATFYITGVQLEKGSTATSFDYRPYGTELALCQRYYLPQPEALLMQGISSGRAGITLLFPVPMRVTPTVTLSTTTPYWESVPYATVGSITSGAAEPSKLTYMGGPFCIVGTFGTTPVQSYPGLFGASQLTFSAEL